MRANLPFETAAQTNYPEKPIRLVVGFPPGSQADTVTRLLGQKLTESLETLNVRFPKS